MKHENGVGSSPYLSLWVKKEIVYLLRSSDAKKVTFLARFSDSAKYKPTFLWDKEVNAPVILYYPSKAYAAELQRAMSKLK